MISYLYSIKDCVAGKFLAPNIFPSDLVMRRALKSVVNGQKGTLISDYPSDCDCYKVGEFDENTGVISHTEPEFMLHCSDLLELVNA